MEVNGEITHNQEDGDIKRGKFCRWITSVRFRIYCAQAFSTWGDQMWIFAVALFLVKMSPHFELRLTATFGLVCSFSAIIFGAPIGNWIDNSPRFSAATKALLLQNSSVVTCAVVVCLIMKFMDDLKKAEYEWIFKLAQAGVIFFGSTANLAGIASSICISKDWVVVISKGNKDKLAAINATCRRIDLTSTILSPLIVGAIMTQVSDFFAAIFIASWNVASMVVAYFLLRSVYNSTPELALKFNKKLPSETAASLTTDDSANVRNADADDSIHETEPTQQLDTKTGNLLKTQIVEFGIAWKTYFGHTIFPAGFGLACLYMTVLAFDGITIGYAYSQGVAEAILGALGGAGAIVGIGSTLFYPMLRRRLGIERTGLIGYFAEISCLVFCVVSVWAPGSPFDPRCILSSCTPIENSSLNVTQMDNSTLALDLASNQTVDSKFNNSTNSGESGQRDYTAIILLMTGIVSARFGLWLVDLTVTQIIQEEVEDSKRGAINGVQNALNMTMDLIKYGLVILFPSPQTFGFLTIVCFAVICIGWASYAIYSWRIRKHILPFHQYFRGSDGTIPPLQTKETEMKEEGGVDNYTFNCD